jgi:hypothetical protein
MELSQNASFVKSFDYDNDGFRYFIETTHNNRFGSMPDCYLLNNNKVFTRWKTNFSKGRDGYRCCVY